MRFIKDEEYMPHEVNRFLASTDALKAMTMFEVVESSTIIDFSADYNEAIKDICYKPNINLLKAPISVLNSKFIEEVPHENPTALLPELAEYAKIDVPLKLALHMSDSKTVVVSCSKGEVFSYETVPTLAFDVTEKQIHAYPAFELDSNEIISKAYAQSNANGILEKFAELTETECNQIFRI